MVSGVWPTASRGLHGLPDLLLRADQKVFRMHQEAVMWLADRLAALGAVYNAIPPVPKEVGVPLVDVLAHGEPDDIRHPPDFTEGV